MIRESADEQPFRIFLFGGPLLQVQGAPRGISPLQASILGLLYGGELESITREDVISLIWPDEAPAIARRRLNQLLYSFKQKTGTPPPFEADGEEIHRALRRTVSDLEEYLQHFEADRLLECARLLARGFLKRVEGQVTRELSDWVSSREGQLAGMVRKRAQGLLARCEKRGEWHLARDAADALFALDPDDEGALRTVMKVSGCRGEFLDAESSLKEFTKRAQARNGPSWTPSRETQDLLDRLRRNGPAAKGTAGAVSDSSLREPALVGREEELRLLRRTVRNPPHRALRGILVSGEAGIGKTRLIREALAGVGVEGQSVFWASLAEFERLIPLNPLIEAFREERIGHVLQGLEEPWKTVLYGVMPHHHQGNGPIPHAPEIQPESVSRRLFEAIDRLLLRVAEDEPIILVIEDIQWADQTTLAALEFLFRRWEKGLFQILFSVRSEEVGRKSKIQSFLENLEIHEDYFEIHLEELNSTLSKGLIQNVSKRRLHPETISHLQALAGGNPFFLIELTLEYLAGRVEDLNLPTEQLRIPLSIKQILRRRLAQLSPESERILNAVSVHRRSISVKNLSKIAGIPEENTIGGLDQLHHFRLIRNEGTNITAAHELIRQTVYQGLNPSIKAWVHERVARLLQESENKPPPDELALHFHEAGESDEALRFASEAADRAEESGATPEALRFLGIAREHTSDPRQVADLLGRMGHLNYLHHNLKEAAPLLESASKRMRIEGDISTALGWEVERVDAHGKTGLLPVRECLDELTRIKNEASTIEEWETLTRALDVEVHLFDHPALIEKAKNTIEEASRYAQLESTEARCRAQAIIALNLYFGDPVVGLNAAREAVELAMSTEGQDLQLHALNRLMVVLLYQGKLHTPEGEKVLSAIADRFSSSGDLMLKFFVKLNRAVWHLEIGELQTAQALFPDAEAVIMGTKAKEASLRLLVNRAELHFSLGEIEASQSDLAKASELISPSSPKQFGTVISAGLGLCALHEGKLSVARAFESGLPHLPECWTFDPSVIVSFKAEMLRMRGDLGLAELFLGKIAESVRDRFVTAWLKLTLKRAYLLRRISKERSREVALEGVRISEGLGLRVRTMEFLSLVENQAPRGS
ncbi:MAG: AAA family ATPase [Longimicrobiales bacterium]